MEANKELEDKLEELFQELVPDEGNADTLAGELVRAAMRINYRWYNDGDMVGRFSRNGGNIDGPYQFILDHISSNLPSAMEIAENYNEYSYQTIVNKIIEVVVGHIEDNPQLKTTPNKEDMFDTEYEEFMVCDDCGQIVEDGSGYNGSDDSCIWDKAVEALSNYDGWSDAIAYHYGSYYIENDEMESAASDLYSDWWRQANVRDCLCDDCVDSLANDAADYIADNFEEYDDEGYSRLTGRNEDGYDRDGYDEDGYDEDGRNEEGYDRDGYDTEGRDRKGYDREGYDKDGLDSKGLGKDRKMGSDKAFQHFFGASKDEDLKHNSDFYRKRESKVFHDILTGKRV